jgi:hypothetical protein
MRRFILIVFILFLSKFAFCQSHGRTFEYHLQHSVEGFTDLQVDSFLLAGNFENFRLLDQRTTLTFDNGFEITLLSATEAGLNNHSFPYPVAFPAHYKLPVFHLSTNGRIAAGYATVEGAKYKGR